MLRKIAELAWNQICIHPEHNPPSHIVLSPGVYEHECPGCGAKTIFRINGIRLGFSPQTHHNEINFNDGHSLV